MVANKFSKFSNYVKVARVHSLVALVLDNVDLVVVGV